MLKQLFWQNPFLWQIQDFPDGGANYHFDHFSMNLEKKSQKATGDTSLATPHPFESGNALSLQGQFDISKCCSNIASLCAKKFKRKFFVIFMITTFLPGNLSKSRYFRPITNVLDARFPVKVFLTFWSTKMLVMLYEVKSCVETEECWTWCCCLKKQFRLIMYALSTTLFVLMIVSHLIVGELSSKFMSLPNVYLKCI